MGKPAIETAAAPPPPSYAAWCRTGLWVGFQIGFACAVAGQLFTWFLVSRTLRDSATAQVLAVLATASAFACVGLAAAIATGPLVRTDRRRWVTVFAAVPMGPLAALHALMVGVRIFTGSFPAMAGAEMAWNSPSQFFHAAIVGNTRQLLILVGVAMASWAMTCVLLARPVRPGRRIGAATVALAGAGIASLLWWIAHLNPTTPGWRALVSTSPELAVLASFGDDSSNVGAALAISGAPLSAGADWRRAVRDHGGDRPNVILLVMESVPASHLGFAGYPVGVSPNLDALARTSQRYTRAWSTSAQSNYAQMAILSSLLPLRSKSMDKHDRLDYPRFLFQDALSALGYTTATISSQNENWQGMRRFENTGTSTFFFDSNDHPGPYIGAGEEKKVPDHLTTDVLLGWLAKAQEPWAVYVNLQRTHFPYDLPPGFTGRWQPSEPSGSFSFLHYPPEERETVVHRYDNALEYVDAQVGRIASFLAEADRLDDTLWVITSDHGEMFGEHDVVTHGKTLHEGQARVPLLFHWPRRLAAGDVDLPVSHLDLLPTLLELLGAPPYPGFQGESFADAAAQRVPGKGIFMALQSLRTVDSVVCWPWKMTIDHTARTASLWNLAVDPLEMDDQASSHERIAATLMETVGEQMAAQVRYHADTDAIRFARYAPRLLRCPQISER